MTEDIDITKPRRTCKIQEGQFMTAVKCHIITTRREIELYKNIEDDHNMERMLAQTYATCYTCKHRRSCHTDMTEEDEVKITPLIQKNLIVIMEYFDSRKQALPTIQKLLPLINGMEYEDE